MVKKNTNFNSSLETSAIEMIEDKQKTVATSESQKELLAVGSEKMLPTLSQSQSMVTSAANRKVSRKSQEKAEVQRMSAMQDNDEEVEPRANSLKSRKKKFVMHNRRNLTNQSSCESGRGSPELDKTRGSHDSELRALRKSIEEVPIARKPNHLNESIAIDNQVNVMHGSMYDTVNFMTLQDMN